MTEAEYPHWAKNDAWKDEYITEMPLAKAARRLRQLVEGE
jgi:hypothetical protein